MLKPFINTFYGYGDYQANYWLVGMEEGGAGSLEEIARRLTKWDIAGRHELADLMPHHEWGDLSNFVNRSAKLQATWRQLIRVVLSIENKVATNDAIRTYQQSQLGRFGGNTCLLELMPLPSPDAGTWLYQRYSLLPELRSRSAYIKHYAPYRAQQLRHKIEEYKPKVVLFYSLSYVEWWRHSSGIAFTPLQIANVKSYIGRNAHTFFAIVPQPAARIKGKGNAYYEQVGKLIAENLAL